MDDERRTYLFLSLPKVELHVHLEGATDAETFAEARRAGLHVVAHAGETTGSQTIRDAIELLQAERIGHGIRCLDDPDLVTQLKERQTPMEVCPTSNYCPGVVKHESQHPIRQMVDAGLVCTFNSDDPPMFNTSLINEYRSLARQGFTLPELARLNLNAIQTSFLSAEEKRELVLMNRYWMMSTRELSSLIPKHNM
jgi:adenosine deaminase